MCDQDRGCHPVTGCLESANRKDRYLEDRKLFRTRASRGLAGAIAPAWRCACCLTTGAKAPGQAPDPPPAGAGLLSTAAGLRATVPNGRGYALRLLLPPALAKALSPLQWQGPSPLPQRCAGNWTSRGPKPPASARPAPGGRFSPAGSGAGLPLFPDLPVYRAPSHKGGGNAVRFLFPPGGGAEGLAVVPPTPLPWLRPLPLPHRHAAPCPPRAKAPGQVPAASPTGPPAGAGLRCACMTGPCRTVVLDRAGKRRLSTPARGASPNPTDQGDFPVRQAAGMPVSTRQRQGHSPVPALWTGGSPAARFVPAGPLI